MRLLFLNMTVNTDTLALWQLHWDHSRWSITASTPHVLTHFVAVLVQVTVLLYLSCIICQSPTPSIDIFHGRLTSIFKTVRGPAISPKFESTTLPRSVVNSVNLLSLNVKIAESGLSFSYFLILIFIFFWFIFIFLFLELRARVSNNITQSQVTWCMKGCRRF